jgi:Secretion system C-terminal sorting domain
MELKSTRKLVLLTLAILIGGSWTMAQIAPSSKPLRIPRSAQVNFLQVKEDYSPTLMRIEAPTPGGNSEKAWLAAQKAQLETARQAPAPSSQKVDSTAPSPWIGVNFPSLQVIGGVPNDNDMAVSNGGKVISVGNTSIYVHNANGTAVGSLSLDAWAAPLGLSGSKFDPRALYDPAHDRFIVSCLNGYTDSTSYVIVGFSQTNDPAGAWNLYALPGDPNNDSLWTDYPIMALNANELFLTGNLLYNDQPWQTGFNQSICWQIDLDSAFAGGTLDTRLWFNVQFGGRPIRNLCPIQAGSTPSGNNMYLLSNRNFATGNDTVFILEITDSMHAPGVQLTVDYGITDVTYALAPNAHQEGTHTLATNDARWLDGFIENGNIQFVGNTLDTTTGRAAVYHGTITDVTGARTVTGHILGNANGDYGYPAISWMGMSPADNDALLTINYVGTTVTTRPGCGAIYCDGQGNYSPLVVAKAGAGFIDALTGTDRWGDYSGTQRKYDENGVVWTAATFGKSNHFPGTWVAEFHHPSIVGTEPKPLENGFEVTAFPNPTADMIAVEFALEADAFLEIGVWDMQGRLVKTMLRDRVRAGKSRFSFSTAPLAAGSYLLRVMDGDQVLASKHLVKAN